MNIENKYIKAKVTAHNIRYTLRRSSGLAYRKTQSACGLCAFFCRHIFAVAGNLRFPLSQLQKRRIAFTLCAIVPKRGLRINNIVKTIDTI
ncbi:hypothetical protein AGMMS49579_18630 [Spirochaetia bacterium]|nr:hypothetical protein AGMMS49579_18630 [Spirochaetia bacterium]